ncbi:Uncharacterized protein FLJ43738 [Durusdinium trenchii]|uniref:Uncharacterized protein FLJ43738 n=1 Tax=Durusdinium trenchii TaxID=1381693 RepID=A0ABP0STL8_9DINO
MSARNEDNDHLEVKVEEGSAGEEDGGTEEEETQGEEGGDDEEEADEGPIKQTVRLVVGLSLATEKGTEETRVEEKQGHEPRQIKIRFSLPGVEQQTTAALATWQQSDALSAADLLSKHSSSPAQNEVENLTNELPETIESKSDTSGGDNNAKLRTTLWSTSCDVVVDLAWARAVNECPTLVFTVGSEEEAWLGAFGVDISSLLDGRTKLTSTLGEFPGLESQHLAPLPPALQRATSAKALQCTIAVDKACLTKALSKVVNPLTVSLVSARPLPGLIVEEGNVTLQPFVTDPITKRKDPFYLQKRHCEPVYATLELSSSLLVRPRLLRSVGFAHGKTKLRFAMETTLLVGELDKDRVVEALQNESVTVCLHDRDVELITTQAIQAKHRQIAAQSYARVDTQQQEEEPQQEEGKQKGDNDQQQQEQEETENERMLSPKSKQAQVDAAVYRDFEELLRQHSRQQTCGTATFSLAELWTSSKELIGRHRQDLYGARSPVATMKTFSVNSRAAELDAQVSVVPIKRSIPVGGDVEKAELDIGDAERMVRQPGRYLEAGTEVRLRASLMWPLHWHRKSVVARTRRERNEQVETLGSKFERVIFLFPYNDLERMQRVRAALDEINARALPDAVSLRSHQLSAEEVDRANRGMLDILTGFQVVDDDFRIIVLEGLSDGGVRELLDKLPRERPNDDQSRTLCNSQVRFSERLYTEFDVDLKIIRLRDPLVYIMQAPEIYDSFKVDLDCHQALVLLATIRSSLRIQPLARSQSFPTPEMLIKLESKYGESVSLQDMDGVVKTTKVRLRQRSNQEQEVLENGGSSEMEDVSRSKEAHSMRHGRRKAPTDSHNPQYLEQVAQREEKNFLEEHRMLHRKVQRSTRQRLQSRAKADAELLAKYGGGENQQAFMYSGQKLNFVERQQDQMRQRLAQHTGITYTYSSEFQSLAFPLVNEEQIARDEKHQARERFISKRGFVYPAPRDSAESRKGKIVISEARAEELRHPWEEPNRPRRDRAEHGPDFDCIPTNDYVLFGGYHRDGSRNPDFFRSVHLAGSGSDAEAQAAKQLAEKEWRDKVIVDSLSFQAHQGIKTDKPSQLDKLQDILRHKPRKKGFRVVRNARLPSGKPVPLRPAPVSIHLGPQEEEK